jgi:hypothetical protein
METAKETLIKVRSLEGDGLQVVRKTPQNLLRLYGPLKESASESFVTGHDFSRADRPFIFLPEPALAGGT